MSARKQARGNGAGPNRKPDRSRRASSSAEQLEWLRNWLLPDERIFANLARHGNTKWTPQCLVWLALCWGWGESKNVTDAFDGARDQCRMWDAPSLTTYQGFMNALGRWTDLLMPVLWRLIHERMQQIGGEFWQIAGWVPLGFDGSRSSVPRTVSNEQALCAANYGRGPTARYRKKKTKGLRRRKNKQHKPQPQKPQVWTTLVWHMGLRLPWMWHLGPSNSSERGHVSQMLDIGNFPKRTLFCGDAGFVGYPLWNQIVSGGHEFLVRVGANIKLLTEAAHCEFERDGQVLCWPKTVRESGQSPLRLRLIQVKTGQTRLWLLTSVLERRKLSQKQAARFYRMRWGIEVEFRGLKQTLDRGKLRCRNSRRVLTELNWSIAAMAVAELFALKEQLAPKCAKGSAPADPARRSLALTMRALRSCLRDLQHIPAAEQDLPTRLRQAVTDGYTRLSQKRARYHPTNKDKRPIGDPKLRKLTPIEKETLDELTSKLAA
jgi:hypothetical protein